MCGRARLSSDVSEIKIAFGIPPERPTPNIAPSWNVAPTDPAPWRTSPRSPWFAQDSPQEGSGFELPVPVRQAKLTRSCR